MPNQDLSRFKLFPRNLTARADALVRGNPVTTRPESGVENCFPGLEFDQRNLDRVFFPGLAFEMHHASGVIIRDFDAGSPAATFLRRRDITEGGIFLAFVQGVFASRLPGVKPAPRLLRLTPPAGLESWRMVHDLEVGDVAVVLCGASTFQRVANGELSPETVSEWLKARQNREVPHSAGPFVLLFGQRARYLDANGVIDPAGIHPGELTQSLCSPWQYDFADCGCFYWASNKPDLVAGRAQPAQVLNFQRRNRTAEADLASTADDWVLRDDYAWDGERAILRHAEMLTEWEKLPFVVRRRETDRYTRATASQSASLLDAASIVQRLRKLATVEHALAVEYLYAYYSLGLPAARLEALDPVQAAIQSAGREIFEVAIDEMRHLRSVNEILIELGQQAELGRASIIGEDFDGTGKSFNHQFVLDALKRKHLDWFIAVEAASQNQDDQSTIDGMYTLILRSVAASSDFSPEQKARLVALIKVIIDEGLDHHVRFLRARRSLAGIPEDQYLKVVGGPQRLPAADADSVLQDSVDLAYAVVLRALDYAFRLGDAQRGAAVESARRAMYNMDDAARSLAMRSKGALFDFTRFSAAGAVAAGASPFETGGALSPKAVGEPLWAMLGSLRGVQPDLAQRMEQRLRKMTSEFERFSGEQ